MDKDNDLLTIKAPAETRQQLKVLAALNGKTMQVVLAQMVNAEYQRMIKENAAQRASVK